MSVELRRMQAEDLYLIQPRPEYRDGVRNIIDHDPHVFEGPYSHTLWHAAGLPLACAGIMSNSESWAILSPQLKGYGILFSSYVVEYGLKPWVRDTGKAVTAHVDNDFTEAVKWVKLLGFRPVREWSNQTLWVYDENAA